MPKKGTIVRKLLDQLEADPEYRRKRALADAALAKLEAECARDEEELVREIRSLGYDIDSVWDLVNNSPHPYLERRFIGPYERAYPTLLHHLTLSHHRRIREGIIRALTVKDGGTAVEQALLSEFENEANPELRWVLANALKTAMPYHRRRKRPEIAETFKRGI